MKSTTLIIQAKWIITGNHEQPALENHSMVIHNGLITEILTTSDAKGIYPHAELIDYPHHAVMPGFINAHTHIGMNYFRGLGNDLPLMDWLTKHIFPAEKKWLSHEFVRDASLFAMAEMIRSGTTCFNDMFYFLQATAEAAQTAGMRAFIGMTVIEFPTPWAESTNDYFNKGMEFYESYQHHPLISTTFAPHAPYTVSDESFIRIRDLAEKHDLKINLHLHETLDEINQSLTQFKKRPIKRLHDLGFISPRLISIHSANLNEEDLNILQITKPSIVHCPESNMKLASGICPVERLQSLGINVALGTDSVASNNDLDMISEMKTANFLAKITSRNPVSLNAHETIELATLCGAKALGVDHLIGSLSQGKAADFIAIDLHAVDTLPTYDPIAQIVYSSGRHQVSDVWVSGKQLMHNRQLLTIDEEHIKEKAMYWGNKIRSN